MHISNLAEVDEGVWDATIEYDDGSVIVYTFHGIESFKQFLTEDMTNGSSDSNDASYATGRVANTSYRSMLRH